VTYPTQGSLAQRPPISVNVKSLSDEQGIATLQHIRDRVVGKLIPAIKTIHLTVLASVEDN
jgi:hypothetical protein